MPSNDVLDEMCIVDMIMARSMTPEPLIWREMAKSLLRLRGVAGLSIGDQMWVVTVCTRCPPQLSPMFTARRLLPTEAEGRL